MITLIDYDIGNLGSLSNTFNRLGYSVNITNNATEILKANILILPGVGSAVGGMNNLKRYKLDEMIIEHIKKDNVEGLLDLIYKKLKPSGMLIMEVPNADSPLGVHIYFSDLTHEFAFSKKLGMTLLRHAGFDEIQVMYSPNMRNPLIKLAQKIMAKVVGFEHEMMFSGNIILVGYKNKQCL